MQNSSFALEKPSPSPSAAIATASHILLALIAIPFNCKTISIPRPKTKPGKEISIPFFPGGFVKPTQDKWNHSRGQASLSQATISPKLISLQ
jgi:hypothetical protein